MRSKMIIEMLFASKRLLAHRAPERFVGGMTFHVALQAGIVGKHIVANVAREHFIAIVRFAVMRQFHRTGERLAAHLTNERLAFVVIASMHDELVFEGEHFAADVACMHRRRWHGRLIVGHGARANRGARRVYN